MRLIVLDDGETYGLLDGSLILEVGPAGLDALEGGESIRMLVESGEAEVVAQFIDGECRSPT